MYSDDFYVMINTVAQVACLFEKRVSSFDACTLKIVYGFGDRLHIIDTIVKRSAVHSSMLSQMWDKYIFAMNCKP